MDKSASKAEKRGLPVPPPPPSPPPCEGEEREAKRPRLIQSSNGKMRPPPPPSSETTSKAVRPPPPPPPPTPPSIPVALSSKPPPPPPTPPRDGLNSQPVPSTEPSVPNHDSLPPPPPPTSINGAPNEDDAQRNTRSILGRQSRQRAQRCRDVTDYQRLGEKVGEGQYGEVFLAKDPETGFKVAMKKLKMHCEGRDGFPITAIREIKILQNLKHKNIVDLVEIVTNGQGSSGHGPAVDDSVYMVFEYMDYDLQGLVYRHVQDVKAGGPGILSQNHVRSYMKQILEGVLHMHRNKVFHRDLKGCNILVNHSGQLKIADFGLARSWNERLLRYTTPVITCWFRPPELFLGLQKYDSSVDIWSVGCIFGELLLKKPLIPGRTDADQLEKIFQLLGTPKLTPGAPGCATEPSYQFDLWPSATALPQWPVVQNHAPCRRILQERFRGNAHLNRGGRPVLVHDPNASVEAVDLLEKMLALDPLQRIKALDALDHDYFWRPTATPEPEQLPRFKFKSAHEIDMKTDLEKKRTARNGEK